MLGDKTTPYSTIRPHEVLPLRPCPHDGGQAQRAEFRSQTLQRDGGLCSFFTPLFETNTPFPPCLQETT